MSSMTAEEIRYYQMSGGDKRAVVRAALKAWREQHPDLLPVRSLHHGWYGWVLESTVGERGMVANVMKDCIVPYLRATAQPEPEAPKRPQDYPPVEVVEASPGRRVRHSCGGTLYRTSLPGVRWCDRCEGWIPWEGETGSTGSRDIFTASEQAAIDAEPCRDCSLPYIDHDGTEEHLFQGRR